MKEENEGERSVRRRWICSLVGAAIFFGAEKKILAKVHHKYNIQYLKGKAPIWNVKNLQEFQGKWARVSLTALLINHAVKIEENVRKGLFRAQPIDDNLDPKHSCRAPTYGLKNTYATLSPSTHKKDLQKSI